MFSISQKVAPYGFFKSEKCEFQPQKLPMDIWETRMKLKLCIE